MPGQEAAVNLSAATEEVDELIEAMVAASRAFVGVAAESVAALSPDLTLPQYRLLVVLATRGGQNLNSLAAALGVTPSTVSRMCDRLLRKKLIRRETSRADRRQVRLGLTDDGRALHGVVMARRREGIAAIVGSIPEADRAPLIRGLRIFSEATEDAASEPWLAGWSEGLVEDAAPRTGSRSPDG